jgi:hypothetical protein
MKKNKLRQTAGTIIALAVLASAFMVACGRPPEPVERFVYDSKGYPDQKTVENLFEEMDYQRAVQAYL